MMLVIFLLLCFAHPPDKRNVTSLVDLSMDEMPGLRVVLDSETTSLSSLSSLPQNSHLNPRPKYPSNSPLEQNNGQATLVLLTIVLVTIFVLYLSPQD